MARETPLPRYDIEKTYRWNHQHAPAPVSRDIPTVEKASFAGLPASGPIGIAAGPLLNGKWILYYASLGFDVLTYKTVRSRPRDCYPLPNLVHVPDTDRFEEDTDVEQTVDSTGSWAVSFGMPSLAPDAWRADIEATRRALPESQILNVSVVGSVQPGWSMEDLAADYARCAVMAVDSGADSIEANLSCPNVSTCDGQLYQQPERAGLVARTIREQIGDVPLILKIGHLSDQSAAAELLHAVAEPATALAMTNSVAARVRGRDRPLLFNGQRRGICGEATFRASLRQVSLFSRLKSDAGLDIRLIGVGGASSADHVRQYLSAGAECVHVATAAMLHPELAITMKTELAKNDTRRSSNDADQAAK